MKPPLDCVGDTGQTGSRFGAGRTAAGKGLSARPAVPPEGQNERSYQALLPAVSPDGAQVHPQGLLLQGRLGDGHSEHVTEQQGLRSWEHSRSKQTADVTWGGKQSNPEIPAKNKDETDSPVQQSWLRSWCLEWSSWGRSTGGHRLHHQPQARGHHGRRCHTQGLGGSVPNTPVPAASWIMPGRACPLPPCPTLGLQQRPSVGKWGGQGPRSGRIYVPPAHVRLVPQWPPSGPGKVGTPSRHGWLCPKEHSSCALDKKCWWSFPRDGTSCPSRGKETRRSGQLWQFKRNEFLSSKNHCLASQKSQIW